MSHRVDKQFHLAAKSGYHFVNTCLASVAKSDMAEFIYIYHLYLLFTCDFSIISNAYFRNRHFSFSLKCTYRCCLPRYKIIRSVQSISFKTDLVTTIC
jgi:hypothetical protein